MFSHGKSMNTFFAYHVFFFKDFLTSKFMGLQTGWSKIIVFNTKEHERGPRKKNQKQDTQLDLDLNQCQVFKSVWI